MYGLKTDWEDEASPRYFTLESYEGITPRWCPGCGDLAVLTAVQRLCRDAQLPPEKTVFVSGIGCSSRFPHYMNTYGFHGLHGRALPVACGIRSRRPDLHIFVATGDGDCISIGAGHWVHAIHYNMNMVVMLLDNNVYGLTKNQTSPTSARGRKTNTHPRGGFFDPINPVQTTLGIANASFVAQTVDWSPPHLLATLKAAHEHPGLAFVRILQRCPHFSTPDFEALQRDRSKLVLLTHPDGIELDEASKRTFEKHEVHDPSDLNRGRELAGAEDAVVVGLFYRNPDVDRYDLHSAAGVGTSRTDKLTAVEAELDRYRI